MWNVINKSTSFSVLQNFIFAEKLLYFAYILPSYLRNVGHIDIKVYNKLITAQKNYFRNMVKILNFNIIVVFIFLQNNKEYFFAHL